MAIPAHITAITVTSTYLLLDGTPATGTVEFRLSASAQVPVDSTLIPQVPIVGTLAVGVLSVVLPATDDPDWAVTGLAYQVTERITGTIPRVYYINVPAASPGGALNLAAVAPAVPGPVLTSYVLAATVGAVGGPAGPLDAGGKLPAAQVPASASPVQSVAGKTGVVTLAAADVAGVETPGGAQAKADAAQTAAATDATTKSSAAQANAIAASAQRASNLSDLASATTARANLDVPRRTFYDVRDYGATGDGVTDDTAAIQAALVAAYNDSVPSGGVVSFPLGQYRISSTLTVPPYVTVQGSFLQRGSNTQFSCIKGLPGFVGTALVRVVDQATGGYSGPSLGQKFFNITLDGSAINPATVVSGMVGLGKVRSVVMRDVAITGFSDRGVQTAVNASGSPYSWYLDNVQVSDITLDGFRLSQLTDSTLIGCRAIGCGRRGWYIDSMANSTFIGCRSEFSGENGWYLTASWGTGTGSGGAVFTGCSTDRNDRNGFLIDATGNTPLIFNGLLLRRDGRNGGTGGGGYAGFAVSASTCPIIVSGINVYPGVDDNGTATNSPQVGFTAANSTFVQVESGYLHAATTAFVDGGGNTLLLRGPGVGTATGTTVAPVRSTSVGWNWRGAATAVRDVASNTILDVLVVGDTVARATLKADGAWAWGPGSGAQDATLTRSGANALALTTADLRLATAGRGLRVAEGANAKQGSATLVAGTVTVPNTSVTANSRILVTSNSDGGTPGWLRVSARVAGASFTITSSSASDVSVVAWQIFEPA